MFLQITQVMGRSSFGQEFIAMAADDAIT